LITVISVEVAMITLEVHNQLITWPDDFAIVMMRYYKKHDVPFMLRWRHSTGLLKDSEQTCVSEEILAMAKDKGLSTSC
jgi:hypothetical protein